MPSEYDRIPWGEETHWLTTYEERLDQIQVDIDTGGRDTFSADDLRAERNVFEAQADPIAYDTRDCPEYGVNMGDLHSPGCDIEECPICGDQLLGCGHATGVWGDD